MALALYQAYCCCLCDSSRGSGIITRRLACFFVFPAFTHRPAKPRRPTILCRIAAKAHQLPTFTTPKSPFPWAVYIELCKFQHDTRPASPHASVSGEDTARTQGLAYWTIPSSSQGPPPFHSSSILRGPRSMSREGRTESVSSWGISDSGWGPRHSANPTSEDSAARHEPGSGSLASALEPTALSQSPSKSTEKALKQPPLIKSNVDKARELEAVAKPKKEEEILRLSLKLSGKKTLPKFKNDDKHHHHDHHSHQHSPLLPPPPPSVPASCTTECPRAIARGCSSGMNGFGR
ncbi:hypothetical protein BDZ89DRAFT_1162541 [Hymenopellis radicata]|nr:hypothetical protein BDZ89DRAFT_1162541 [Hymenopellis radicata]